MLGGIAPIFLFNFFKLTKAQQDTLNNKVPLVGKVVTAIGLPPIPLYLDENFTGVLVDTEAKNIDLETDIESKKDGSEPTITQRALNTSVTINLNARKDSPGLIILSAMMDVILPKVASREYSISYLHLSTTVFNAQLKSFAIDQDSNSTLAKITIQLINGTKAVPQPVTIVGKVTAPVPSLNVGAQ